MKLLIKALFSDLSNFSYQIIKAMIKFSKNIPVNQARARIIGIGI